MSQTTLKSTIPPETYETLPASIDLSRCDEHTVTFTVGGGFYQAMTTADPVCRKNVMTGAWELIDRRVRKLEKVSEADDTTDSADTKQPVILVSDDVRMTDSGADGFITVDRTVWGVKDCASVQPVVVNAPKDLPDGNVPLRELREHVLACMGAEVLYKEVLPGIDLYVEIGAEVSFRFVFADKDSAQTERQEQQTDRTIVLTAGGVEIELSPARAVPPEFSLAEFSENEWICTLASPSLSGGTRDGSVSSDILETTYVDEEAPGTNYSATTVCHVRKKAGTTGERLTYLRVNALPSLGSDHYITGAYLHVSNYNAESTDRPVFARLITKPWDCATVTYSSNLRLDESKYLDYFVLKGTYYRTYEIDVTDPAIAWYHGSNNFGICLVPNTFDTYNVATFHSAHTIYSAKKPYFTVNYASLAGLEGYFTYDGQSAGRAGSGYVSLHNGNLVFAHSDTVMNGERMPVSITHYYNACRADSNEFFMGYGWRTSLHQTLCKELQGTKIVYVMEDGDGTEHWFEPEPATSTTNYEDTSGLSLKLTVGSTSITVRDKGDNVMTFPLVTGTPTSSNPRTAKVLVTRIADARGNHADITATGLKITKVTDGAGRETNFSYTAGGSACTAIWTPWQTASTGTRFTYSSLHLSTVTYEDGQSSSYTYSMVNGFHLLTSATGPEGLKASYAYHNTAAAGGLPYSVVQATVTGGTNTASDVSYAFGSHVTVATDETTGKKLRYHFNDRGNCVSVDDELGYAVYTEYDQSGENEAAPVNHATLRSRMQRVVANLLVDGSQEKNSGLWITANEVGNGTFQRAESIWQFGLVSRKITINDNGGRSVCKQTCTAVEPGGSYTLSCYVRSDGPNAYLRVAYAAGGNTVTVKSDPSAPVGDGKFHRIAVSFTLPDNLSPSSVTCAMVADTTMGSAYFDAMQLETGLTMNSYNLIENSEFRYGGSALLPTYWTKGGTFDDEYLHTMELSECPMAVPAFFTGRSVQLKGAYNRTITIQQTIRVSGHKGDRLTMGGWCSAFTKRTDQDNDIQCRMYITFGTSNYASAAVYWNPEEGAWQFACVNVVAPDDFIEVTIHLQLNRQMNFANFAGLFLYKEQFGVEYIYDSQGNRQSSRTLFGQYREAQYDSANNVISSTAPGRTASTVCEWGDTDAEKKKHLLRKMTSPMGTVSTYTYNANGSLTQQQTQNAADNPTQFMRSTTAYTSDGNYVASQTDARAKTTQIVTDSDKGTVTSVTDPRGQTVNYLYDTLRRNTRITTPSSRTDYSYSATKGVLTSAKHTTSNASTPDVTYTFQYDSLLRPTRTIIGTSSTTGIILATNSYILSGSHRGLLANTTYGNGFRVAYTYDEFNRVIAIRHGTAESTSVRYSFAYNARGQVAWMRDHLLDRIVETEYDESGRACRTKTHDTAGHIYTGEVDYEPATGLLSVFRAYIGTGYTRYGTTFAYDSENRVTGVTYSIDSNGAGQTSVTYDALGRVSKRTVKPGSIAYETTYSYRTGGYGTGSTTPLVGVMTQTGETMTYYYDDNGNITTANRGGNNTTYVYNTINELVRVNDEDDPRGGIGGTTWVYTYDHGGNILMKRRWAYTTAAYSSLGTPQETITYTYDTGYWKDQMTSYNGGSTISYDAIGNPLTDGTWTYTWQNGRQLASMTNGTTTASFVYNSDGLRIRKTVGSTVVNYTLHGGNIVHMTHGTTNLHFFYDSENRPAIVVYGGQRYAYVRNLQGDVLGLINDSGTEVVQYVYDAWGKLLATSGEMATTLGRIQPFRYRGYVYDEETGLYYLRSRYYNPDWGRFINADSLVKGNLYCYCSNNPIGHVDPNGRDENSSNVEQWIKRVTEFMDGRGDISIPEKDWRYIRSSLSVTDSDVRETILEIGGLALSAVEAYIVGVLCPALGAAEAFVGGFIKNKYFKYVNEKTLHYPDGNYTVESIYFSDNSVFSQQSDLYELIYGYTDDEDIYVGLWRVSTSSAMDYVNCNTIVLFEGVFTKGSDLSVLINNE